MIPDPASTDRPVAVVTGGGSGIGLAVRRRLETLGWFATSFDLAAAEDEASELPVDVRDRDTLHAAFDTVWDQHGRLDGLVCCAGVNRAGPLEELSWEDWSFVIDIDLHGVFSSVQAAGRLMLGQGRGSIVTIASVAAERGSPRRVAYNTAKAGVIGLTRGAAVEWASRGVRVNAVSPGYVDTPFLRDAVAEGRLDLDEILGRIPSGELVSVDDVAAGVCYLLGPESRAVTGQVLTIDGGFLANMGVGSR